MDNTKNTTKEIVETEIKRNKKTTPLTIPEDTLVKVKSGFYGKLYYKNLVTHERVIWERQGEIQIMTLRELRAMRTTQPAFFKNQWIIIEGVADGEDCNATAYDICKSLAVTEFYKDFIDPSKFNVVCEWSESDIADKINLMSPGAKENLIVALNQFIKNGQLDSIRRIKAFEKALNCDLRVFD